MKIIFEAGDTGKELGTYEFCPEHTEVEIDWGQKAIRIQGMLGKRTDPYQHQVNAAWALTLAFRERGVQPDWDFIDRKSAAYLGTQKDAVDWAKHKVKQHLFIDEAERQAVKHYFGEECKFDLSSPKEGTEFVVLTVGNRCRPASLGMVYTIKNGEIVHVDDHNTTTVIATNINTTDGDYFVERIHDIYDSDYRQLLLRQVKQPEPTCAFKVGDFVTFDAKENCIPEGGPWIVTKITSFNGQDVLGVRERNAVPGSLDFIVRTKDCTPAGGPVSVETWKAPPIKAPSFAYAVETQYGTTPTPLVEEEERTEGDDMVDFFRQRHDV